MGTQDTGPGPSNLWEGVERERQIGKKSFIVYYSKIFVPATVKIKRICSKTCKCSKLREFAYFVEFPESIE